MWPWSRKKTAEEPVKESAQEVTVIDGLDLRLKELETKHKSDLKNLRKQVNASKEDYIKSLKARHTAEIRKLHEELAKAKEDCWYDWEEYNLFKSGVTSVLLLFKGGHVHRANVCIVNKTGGDMFGGDFYQLKTLYGEAIRSTPIAWRVFHYKDME